MEHYDLDEVAERAHRPSDALVEQLDRTDGDIVVLGAAGKMGISLARMAASALDRLPGTRKVIAVSRFSDPAGRQELEDRGVRTLALDLADEEDLARAPQAANVVYLIGRKFGTDLDAAPTWETNAYLPGRVAHRYAGARISAFSSGNVYPFVPVGSGGADEHVPPGPVGEYAQSTLARERVFQAITARTGSPLALIRLNYANDCRYGVLVDIAQSLIAQEPIDLGSTAVNVVWQGDANRYALSALAEASQPAYILNVTGPETISVRWVAEELGRRLGVVPTFTGAEQPTALLNNAGRAFAAYGYPEVPLGTMLDWTAAWIRQGGARLGKPTHFTEREGRY